MPLNLASTMERVSQDIRAKTTSVIALLALQEKSARKVKYTFNNLFRISLAVNYVRKRRIFNFWLFISIGGFYCSSSKLKIKTVQTDGTHPNGQQHGGQKPTEISVAEFCYESVNSSLTGTHKH